jgi:hypothetical protein
MPEMANGDWIRASRGTNADAFGYQRPSTARFNRLDMVAD